MNGYWFLRTQTIHWLDSRKMFYGDLVKEKKGGRDRRREEDRKKEKNLKEKRKERKYCLKVFTYNF